MSKKIENYRHRIGRTGRAGKHGIAYTLLCEDDEDVMPELKAYLETPMPTYPTGSSRRSAPRRGRTGSCPSDDDDNDNGFGATLAALCAPGVTKVRCDNRTARSGALVLVHALSMASSTCAGAVLGGLWEISDPRKSYKTPGTARRADSAPFFCSAHHPAFSTKAHKARLFFYLVLCAISLRARCALHARARRTREAAISVLCVQPVDEKRRWG